MLIATKVTSIRDYGTSRVIEFLSQRDTKEADAVLELTLKDTKMFQRFKVGDSFDVQVTPSKIVSETLEETPKGVQEEFLEAVPKTPKVVKKKAKIIAEEPAP